MSNHPFRTKTIPAPEGAGHSGSTKFVVLGGERVTMPANMAWREVFMATELLLVWMSGLVVMAPKSKVPVNKFAGLS